MAAVWLINGLFCKVFNFVPRHTQIVGSILNTGDARTLTILIGVSEIAMAIWIMSGIWRRLNALAQIVVVATMNTLEFILVPELLLFGRANALFAFLFILLIYYSAFQVNKNLILQH